MQCVWVFSTPYSTLSTINVSTQVESRCVRKKIVQRVNTFLLKNRVADYTIFAQIVANITEARQ